MSADCVLLIEDPNSERSSFKRTLRSKFKLGLRCGILVAWKVVKTFAVFLSLIFLFLVIRLKNLAFFVLGNLVTYLIVLFIVGSLVNSFKNKYDEIRVYVGSVGVWDYRGSGP